MWRPVGEQPQATPTETVALQPIDESSMTDGPAFTADPQAADEETPVAPEEAPLTAARKPAQTDREEKMYPLPAENTSSPLATNSIRVADSTDDDLHQQEDDDDEEEQTAGGTSLKPVVPELPRAWSLDLANSRDAPISAGSNVTIRVSPIPDDAGGPGRHLRGRIDAPRWQQAIECSLVAKGPSGTVKRCSNCCRTSDPVSGMILAVWSPADAGQHQIKAFLCPEPAEDGSARGPCVISQEISLEVAAGPTDPRQSELEVVLRGGANATQGQETTIRLVPRDEYGNPQDYSVWRRDTGSDEVLVNVWSIPGDSNSTGAAQAVTITPRADAIYNATTGGRDILLTFEMPLEGRVAVSVLIRNERGDLVPVGGAGEAGQLLPMLVGPSPPFVLQDKGSGAPPTWVYALIAGVIVILLSVAVLVFVMMKRRAKTKALEDYFFDPERADGALGIYGSIGALGASVISAAAVPAREKAGDGRTSLDGLDNEGPEGGGEGKEVAPLPLRARFARNKAGGDAKGRGLQLVEVVATGRDDGCDISSARLSRDSIGAASASSASLDADDPSVEEQVKADGLRNATPKGRQQKPPGNVKGSEPGSPSCRQQAEEIWGDASAGGRRGAGKEPGSPETVESQSSLSSPISPLARGKRDGSLSRQRARQPPVDDDTDSISFASDDDAEVTGGSDEEEATPTPRGGHLFGGSRSREPETPSNGYSNPLFSSTKEPHQGDGAASSRRLLVSPKAPDGVSSSPSSRANPLYADDGAEPSRAVSDKGSKPLSASRSGSSVTAQGNPFEDDGCKPLPDNASDEVSTNPVPQQVPPGGGSHSEGRGWGFPGFMRGSKSSKDAAAASPAPSEGSGGLLSRLRWGVQKPEPAVADRSTTGSRISEGQDDSDSGSDSDLT